MLIQTFQGRKLSVAEIALEIITIPGSRCRNGFYIIISRHREHGASDGIVPIEVLYHIVDLGAVQARCTGPGL